MSPLSKTASCHFKIATTKNLYLKLIDHLIVMLSFYLSVL
jgi:hypothetical protein